jgi:hypothetical protein
MRGIEPRCANIICVRADHDKRFEIFFSKPNGKCDLQFLQPVLISQRLERTPDWIRGIERFERLEQMLDQALSAGVGR